MPKINQNIQYNSHGQPFYSKRVATFQDKKYVDSLMRYVTEFNGTLRTFSDGQQQIAVGFSNDEKRCTLLLEQIQRKNFVEIRLTACGALIHDRDQVFNYLESFHNNFFT